MDLNLAELIASFITPVVILVLVVWAKGIASNHEKRISLNERIIQKRVEIYESIGQDLNDIYAFLDQVDYWKEFTPVEIIQKKRTADKIIHVNQPYWSDFMLKNMMSLCLHASRHGQVLV